ncbi:MAG: polyphenol oxidase family protein [Acidobacteriota bacterium]
MAWQHRDRARLTGDGSDRSGGRDVHVTFFGKGPETPAAARDQIAAAGDESPEQVSWLRQTHSSDVLEALPGLAGPGDALITDLHDLALAVVTADCVPVLLAGAGGVAAVHAGWRGIVGGIVAAAVSRFDRPPLIAWVGPAISAQAYEVGPDVASQIAAASSDAVVRDGPRGRPHADLPRAVRWQLERAGVAEVRDVGLCTHGRGDLLHSYRREGADAGRNVTLVWSRPADEPG